MKSKLWIGDLVKTPEGAIAMVDNDSCDGVTISLKILKLPPNWSRSLMRPGGIKSAWWKNTELVLLERGPASKYRPGSIRRVAVRLREREKWLRSSKRYVDGKGWVWSVGQ
jgi:hypothetical protein